ncbi:hypothetical protein ABBQ38_011359 [Trebouxia sp. C0009 RCD-2024]
MMCSSAQGLRECDHGRVDCKSGNFGDQTCNVYLANNQQDNLSSMLFLGAMSLSRPRKTSLHLERAFRIPDRIFSILAPSPGITASYASNSTESELPLAHSYAHSCLRAIHIQLPSQAFALLVTCSETYQSSSAPRWLQDAPAVEKAQELDFELERSQRDLAAAMAEERPESLSAMLALHPAVCCIEELTGCCLVCLGGCWSALVSLVLVCRASLDFSREATSKGVHLGNGSVLAEVSVVSNGILLGRVHPCSLLPVLLVQCRCFQQAVPACSSQTIRPQPFNSILNDLRL